MSTSAAWSTLWKLSIGLTMRVTRVDLSAHCNNYWISEVVCSFRFSGEVVRIWLTLDITRQWQRASSGCLYDDQSRVPLVARGPGLLSFSCALCGNSDQWPVSARLCFTPETETEQSLPALWTLDIAPLVTVRDQVPGAGDTMWQWDEPLSQFVQEISMRTPRESCDASLE